MGLGSYGNLLVAQLAAAPSYGSFTTAKSVINEESRREWRPGELYPGKSLHIAVRGSLGTLITTPGTVTFQVMMGAVAVFSTGAIQMNAAQHVNLPFWMDIDLTCNAVGAGTTANFRGMAVLHGVMFTLTAGQVDGDNTMTTLVAPATAPGVGTGFNSTVSNVQDLFTAFSINDVVNTVKIDQYKVYEDN